MSKPVIRVENLGKRYDIGANSTDSLREQLNNMLRRLTGRQREEHTRQEIWALKDINLEVQQGEVLGIIGHNGAGKSTLLKILSRITHPTTGRIEMRGRVSSLLEVGTGFHPELTGRENIFMNAAILGMKRAETKQKFDEIVDFAGVEKFIDTPVKRYSSGMYTRLAFSVAAHLEPEILIVDEVLSVGDAAFQRKSLGKMEDVRQQGRTILFVSHNMASVRHLCSRVAQLDQGEITKIGSPDEIIEAYIASTGDNEGRQITDVSFPENPELPMQIIRVQLLDEKLELLQPDQLINKDCHIQIVYRVHQPVQPAYVACQVDDQLGSPILWTYDGETEAYGKREVGMFTTRFKIEKRMLTTGIYHVHCMIVDIDHGVIDYPGVVFSFSVLDDESLLARRQIRWPASIGYNPEWQTEKIHPNGKI